MAFSLQVLAFNEGETIPQRHTCEGEDVSPALEWHDLPAYTRSLALIVDDPDAPAGTWNHWVLWDIPAAVHGLEENFQPGQVGVSGTNDFGKLGYGGPCPPRGHGPHRYYFRLLALDMSRMGVREGAKRADLEKAMLGHVMGEATVIGRYERT